MVSESVPQSTTAKFDLGLSGLASLLHIRKLFFTNLQGVVHAYKLSFELTIFCWVDKMSCVHVVSFYNLIGTARPRRRKSTTFPPDVTRLSPPPIFEERAWRRGYWDGFWCILGVKLQNLDNLLLNMVVVFEVCGIKGMTPSGHRGCKAAGHPRKARENKCSHNHTDSISPSLAAEEAMHE